MRQDLSKRLGLLDSLGREFRVVEWVLISGLSFTTEEAIVAASFFGRGVVEAFSVADKMHLSGLIRQEKAKTRRRDRFMGKAVIEHPPGLRKRCLLWHGVSW